MTITTYQQQLKDYNNQVWTYQPMDQFQEKEQLGRQILSVACNHLKELNTLSGTSINGYDYFDIILQLCTHCDYLVGDIKLRWSASTDVTTWALDKKKLDNLRNISNKLNWKREHRPKFIPALINFTVKDQILRIYDLSQNPDSTRTTFYRKNNHTNEKTMKELAFYGDSKILFEQHLPLPPILLNKALSYCK